MTDRILNSAWWLALMLMICAAAAVTLFVGYYGLFELLGGRWASATASLAISTAASVAAFKLCQHRNDLL